MLYVQNFADLKKRTFSIVATLTRKQSQVPF